VNTIPAGPQSHAAAVATLALGALSALTFFGRSQGPYLALDIVVAVVSCGLVPVALRWPVGIGLVLSALAALSPTATPPASATALFAARQRPARPAVLVAVAGVAAHAVQGWWRPASGLSYGWWLLLIAAAYAALVGWGTLAQARQALVESLRERARRAEAEQGRRVAEARVAERARIAREMHDVLAHRLTLVATYAGALEYRPDSPPEQLARAAGVVRTGVHQALDELRQVITVLREDDATPDGAPQPTLADLPALVEESRAAGTSVRLSATVAEVPAVIGRTAYRVVQEGLTNARRHAPGRPVEVVVEGRPGGELVVEVSNPLTPTVDSTGAGTGLIGLTERVHLAGGRLDHGRTADRFRLRARLPWSA
jgi:signal transduction histidine kinase